MNLQDIAVVIPVLDEAESLPLVIGDLPSLEGLRVVVADNGSRDGSPEVAAGLGARVVRAARRGYGSACLAALAELAAAPPQVVVFLDGDYSDHPDELPRLLAPLAGDRADLVIGSRVRGQAEPGALLPQARMGNWLATRLIRLLYGHRYTDLGPFRAITWEALRRLEMSDPDFGWTAEMQVKALRRGLRVTEVPVSYRRRVGVSKITGTVRGTLRAGRKILWTVLRHALAPRRAAPGPGPTPRSRP
jgi:glycosyltransferase involved in cell wall biosynthesis